MDRTTYVRVTWGASPTAGVTRYELEHRRSGTEGWTVGYRGPAREATLRLVVSGSAEIRVRACTSSACSGYIPNPPRIVIETPTFPDYLPETCPAIPVSVPAQENVGAIAAETGVSGGASRVRIPIVGAPGRRGVQPDAALVYSSQGGGDVSGVGISLDGVSRIHRCARTPVHDGVVGSVDFTAAAAAGAAGLSAAAGLATQLHLPNIREGSNYILKEGDAGPSVEAATERDLRRPYIRKGVRAEVNADAPRDASGRPIDPNTGVPIDGKPDLGHKTGNEFRREKAAAKAERLTQKQFNERMNNPDLYQLEDPASNRSHKYEKKP